MNKSAASKTLFFTAISLSALCAGAWSAEAQYLQTDLVSDISGLAAITDPELVNPWGISFSGASPFWVSDQGTNVSTLYAVTGSTNVTKTDINSPSGFVAIPPTGGAGPTGQVNNTNTSSFLVENGGNGGSAHFIFANLNGTISAWDTGTTAFIQATTPGALYTGLAINKADTMLYAADGANGGSINVFNSSFTPISTTGGFVDPNLPNGLVPFNVQDISSEVYVTYAPAGRTAQADATAGMGVVDVYDENGNFLKRLVTGSTLAAPWGITFAPAGWGQFGGDLLVGNFSYVDSGINAFDPTTGAFLGTIPINPGLNDTAGGLWALDFGTGGMNNGDPNTLYFTDGINGEMDGLFGAISVPELSTWVMMLAGFGGLGLVALRRRRRRSPSPIG